MALEPQNVVSPKEVDKGLHTIIKDGLASQTMATLTGGVFLVAFALELGASNFVIGLLAAIPALMQLIQLPSSYLVEKIRNRKKISVTFASLSRLSLLLLISIPFLFSLKAGLVVLTVALALHAGFSAVSLCSWNSWMKDLIPVSRMGPFFSKRLGVTSTLALVLSLVGAYFIDYWSKTFPQFLLHGYAILFFVGFLVGMIGVIFISRIPEPRMFGPKRKLHIFRLISHPFKDVSFKQLIIYLGSLNFAVNLAAPFFTVYMLQRLGLNLTLVIAFQVLTQIVNVIFLRIWGRFSVKHTNKAILSISSPLFMFSILGWTFTTLPDPHFFTIPLLIIIHIVMGMALAGIKLAAGNIRLKLAPQGDSASYLAATSFVNSLAAGIAPLIGGLFADFFSARELSMTIRWTSPLREFAISTLSLQHWDFFFFLAFVVGLYSIHRLSKVEETGTVAKRERITEFIAEIRREIRNLSTVAGIRSMIKFPALVFSSMRKRKEK